MQVKLFAHQQVLCSAFYISCQHDTDHICCWALAMQQSIDISCPPGPEQQTQQWSAAGKQWDKRTDGRTPDQYIGPAQHTTRVVPISANVKPAEFWTTAGITMLQNNTHTHTHPFNGSLSGTTRASQYQKGKTNLDFTEARDSEWQWHQQGRMQVCTSHQTDNHASTSLLSFLQACPSCCPTNSVKALKATIHYYINLISTGFQYPPWLVSFLLPAPTILGLYAFSSPSVLLSLDTAYNSLKWISFVWSNLDTMWRIKHG